MDLALLSFRLGQVRCTNLGPAASLFGGLVGRRDSAAVWSCTSGVAFGGGLLGLRPWSHTRVGFGRPQKQDHWSGWARPKFRIKLGLIDLRSSPRPGLRSRLVACCLLVFCLWCNPAAWLGSRRGALWSLPFGGRP